MRRGTAEDWKQIEAAGGGGISWPTLPAKGKAQDRVPTYQIVDATQGDDWWTCGDPPSKLPRYTLARLIDGKPERTPDGALLDGLTFSDFKKAFRVLDQMNADDFAAYVPPDFRIEDWKEQRCRYACGQRRSENQENK